MYYAEYFQMAVDFLDSLPEKDRGKIKLAARAIETGSFTKVRIKSIQSPIKELIVKNYRILFFIKGNHIYFLSGFVKKTAKTPKREIERAMQMYKLTQ